MKKILFFVLILFCSKIALADGGIPLIIFAGSNFFITGNLLPPFFFGLLLFWLVCLIERWYLVKKLNIKEKITKPVIMANIYSTLWGIPFSGLLSIQYSVCSNSDIMCGLFGPLFPLSLLVSLFLLGWMSWFVEYRYLRKRLNYPRLKKVVAFANLYSYIGMTLFSVSLAYLGPYIADMLRGDCFVTCQNEAARDPHLTLRGTSPKIIGCHCDFCDDRIQKCNRFKK